MDHRSKTSAPTSPNRGGLSVRMQLDSPERRYKAQPYSPPKLRSVNLFGQNEANVYHSAASFFRSTENNCTFCAAMNTSLQAATTQDTPVTCDRPSSENCPTSPTTPISTIRLQLASRLYLDTPESLPPFHSSFTLDTHSNKSHTTTPLGESNRRQPRSPSPTLHTHISTPKKLSPKKIYSSPEKTRNILESVPEEIAMLILQKLSQRDLCMVSAVCRSWRHLADRNVLWEPLCRLELSLQITPGSWRRVYCDLRNYQRQPHDTATRKRRRSMDVLVKFGLYDSPISQGRLGSVSETTQTPPTTPPCLPALVEAEKENWGPMKNGQDRPRRPRLAVGMRPRSPPAAGFLRSCPQCHTLNATQSETTNEASCNHCGHTFCTDCLRPMAVHPTGTACSVLADGRSLGEVTNTIALVIPAPSDDEPMRMNGSVICNTTKVANRFAPVVGHAKKSENVRKGSKDVEIAGGKTSKQRLGRL